MKLSRRLAHPIFSLALLVALVGWRMQRECARR
jgi:hypothetical protein